MAFAFEVAEAACDAPAEGHDGDGGDDARLEAGTEAVAKEEAHAEAAGSAWDLAEVASWGDTRARFKHVFTRNFCGVLFEEEQARPLTSVITYHSLRGFFRGRFHEIFNSG